MSHSIDVTEENFMQDVIQASHETLVLVDFWATWCGPCQTLLPLLEQLAIDYNGQFKLAKVETDSQQNLAGQFGVRSVPTVKLVKNGEIVDEFTGALPENQLREYIDKHLAVTEASPLQEALQQYQQGNTEQALQLMQQLLLDFPDDPNIRIEFANILMREKRFDDAKDLLNSLSAADKTLPAAASMFAQLAFINTVVDAPGLEDLLSLLEKEPANSKAREQLCAHYILRGDYEAGMEQLLEIIRRDRQYKDDYARLTLLQIFDILGQGELVSQYRRKLAQALN